MKTGRSNLAAGPASVASFSSYAQYFAKLTADPAVIISSVERRFAGRTPIDMFRGSQSTIFPDPATPDICLQLIVGGQSRLEGDFGFGRFTGRLRTGNWVIAPANTPINVEGDGRYHLQTLSFSESAAAELLEMEAGSPVVFGGLHAGIQPPGLVSELLHRIWCEAVLNDESATLFADQALLTLLGVLRRDGTAPPPRHVGRLDWRIRRALEYMMEHLYDDISVRDLASLTDLSPAHFARAFKAATGTSPYRHLIDLRLDRAEVLLANSNQSITEIALSVGFGSSAHFANTYRRMRGKTPKAFRRIALD